MALRIFNITKKHIACGDLPPEIAAISDRMDVDLFSTGVNIYYTNEHGLPTDRYVAHKAPVAYDKFCEIGNKLREWLNDYQQAWTPLLHPEPVKLELKNGVLDIKGEYNSICDVKLDCTCEDDVVDNCGCWECENGCWDRDIEKVIARQDEQLPY